MKKACLSATLLGSLTLPAAAVDAFEDWLYFSAHLRAVAGVTTGDYEELALHAHDPNQDVTLQGLELGVNLDVNDYLKGFGAVNVFLDTEDELDAEWEEGFLKLANLPGGFELRGGRYLNRFGTQNNVHLHGWSFIDSDVLVPTFLGEEGLITEGGELTWIFERDQFLSAISASFGNAVTHDHHGHGDEDEDEDEDEHGHGGEDAFFSDEVFTARWFGRWGPNDFHQHQVGLNYAEGDNEYDRDSTVWSGDYTYLWRENGLEEGGRSLRVVAEAFYRDVEWMDEHEGDIESGETDHWGASLAAIFGICEDVEAGVRIGWLEGAEGLVDGDEEVFAVEERWRYSAMVTQRFDIGSQTSGLARLQFNYDDLPEGDEQTVVFQIGFDWGGPEIR